MQKTLTIFTPAFNRAHLIGRLYHSLKAQSCQDFEWLIIDDGSTDETQSVVQGFQTEGKLHIRYIKQDNQGMHGAHNTAYENIHTILNTCIDSDDFMPANAVEVILKKWGEIDQNKLAGIIGLDADLQGKIIGSKFTQPTTTLEDFYLSGGSGDKKMVYRTEVINRYPPYPLFEGEKYVGLGYKYQLVDQDFELATLNEVLVIVDYQEGGSSRNMLQQYLRNPQGFAFIRKQGMVLSKSPTKRFKDAVHYVSSSVISGNSRFLNESPKKLLTLAAIPFGLLLAFYVKWKGKAPNNSKEL